MFFSYRLLSLLPILSRFWNQSILAEDCIYFFTGAGIKLRQYADMLLSVTSVDAISVTDLALCHIHFRHPLLSTSGPTVLKFTKKEQLQDFSHNCPLAVCFRPDLNFVQILPHKT